MDKLTLLCVDDDESILRALQRLLRSENYRVLTANSAQEAQDLLATETIEVVMVDQRMPDMNGSDLLTKIKIDYPDKLRLVLSGFADVASILDAVNEGEIYRFLVKPWNDDELKVTLRQCFETYTLRNNNKQLLQTIRDKNAQLLESNNQLEQTLNTQTMLLNLVQETIDHIPLPLFGIDLQGLVIAINRMAVLEQHNALTLGGNIKDVLPSQTVVDIKSAIQDQTKSKHHLDSQLGELEVIPFNFEKETRGAIIVMQGMHK